MQLLEELIIKQYESNQPFLMKVLILIDKHRYYLNDNMVNVKISTSVPYKNTRFDTLSVKPFFMQKGRFSTICNFP
jgi:hypothetical protein